MDLTPLISAFGIIAVAELGDKTQLAAMTLSTRYRAISVFAGAVLAVALVDGISILAGTAMAEFIPMQAIGLLGAAIFIGFGIYTLVSKETGKVMIRHGKFAVLSTFLMVVLMELGDKTQFSTLALAAKYSAPVLIFLGTVLAYVLIMGISVVVGNKLLRFLPPRYLKILSGALFLFFGVIFLLGVAGINIL